VISASHPRNPRTLIIHLFWVNSDSKIFAGFITSPPQRPFNVQQKPNWAAIKPGGERISLGGCQESDYRKRPKNE
jgi:hypothetical protein